MSSSLFDVLTTGVVYFSLAFLMAALLTVYEKVFAAKAGLRGAVAFALGNGPAALVAGYLSPHGWEILVPLGVAAAAQILIRRWMVHFSASGRLLLVNNFLLALTVLAWGVNFIVNLDISLLTRMLMLAGYPLLVLMLPIGVIASLEQWEVLTRKRWLRPRTVKPIGEREHYPKVCLQVPCYAEPPEVVMATLDRLAALRYPNFEVMVIDNNTKDPHLWKPVEAYCEQLGERFRFFHVDPLAGAKAGALNWAMDRVAGDVEIIGVIDADYHAEADFLSALLGHFDDPRMGFVQTPHDYREWENSLYQRMCYWEYKTFFATTMPSLNEKDAGLTVGTMCLIRRRALDEAGGWSEWCQTEDSELAIRIHALGYTSVFVPQTFGRGLIPETFAGYKKQRFRWTFGPVQEFKQHLRLFLPQPWAEPSELRSIQKLHHMNHGLGPFTTGLSFLMMPVNLAVLVSMLVQGETVAAPRSLWIAAVCATVAGWLLTWLIHRVEMGCSLRDTIGALLAKQALYHTMITASVMGLFVGRIPWRRTDKFKSLPSGLVALASARTELLLGIGCLGLGLAICLAQPASSLLLLLGIGLLFQSLNYLPAPLLALRAEYELQAAQSDALLSPQIPVRKLSVPVRPVAAGAALAGGVAVIAGAWLAQPQPGAPPVVVKSAAPASRPVIVKTSPAKFDDEHVPAKQPPVATRQAYLQVSSGAVSTPVLSTAASGSPADGRTDRRPSLPTSGSRTTAMVGNPSASSVPSDLDFHYALAPSESEAGITEPTSIQLLAVSTPIISDCYDQDFKKRDYRCRNRKN
ncbi:glycosyltransferase [Gloeobacter morelensis]|uniref:Glycosyltransferase n=1 Tax=Gloeobacter morelensis MG652769 TaxID=2781736 RepID=A0ABY3PPW9_9CYAN|nr:glycosyltransferase [Gloeobacter morelensis]UFP95691.1 glycosyltransferase [Gloeobacter morelensis MG652769]